MIDGEKTIIQNPTEEQEFVQEKEEFDVHALYGIDVIISSGEGKIYRCLPSNTSPPLPIHPYTENKPFT